MRVASISRRTLLGGVVGAAATTAHGKTLSSRIVGRERVLMPDLPIVDPHHHLWDGLPEKGVAVYHAPQLLADIDSGHNIVATIFVECHAHYLTDGDPLLRPVGETRFVTSQAAADTRIARGIVGYADLTAGDRVDAILQAQMEAGQGRFRGVRQSSPYDADPAFKIADTVMRDRLDTPAFRAGFARLAHYGLSFDAWCFHPNLPQITRLARAFPDTHIVLDHAGTPLGTGHYADDPKTVFADWRANLAELARCPNVTLKFGGLGMDMGGPMLLGTGRASSSADCARIWQPWFDASLNLFGTKRMMFESNFPVDAAHIDYRTLWNVFKRLAMPLSREERTDLFSRTAAMTYKIDIAEKA